MWMASKLDNRLNSLDSYYWRFFSKCRFWKQFCWFWIDFWSDNSKFFNFQRILGIMTFSNFEFPALFNQVIFIYHALIAQFSRITVVFHASFCTIFQKFEFSLPAKNWPKLKFPAFFMPPNHSQRCNIEMKPLFTVYFSSFWLDMSLSFLSLSFSHG